ncbi:major capsid protein P2 [Psychromonas sp. Urea-02u-13]|uniref:major capsid protein P2 n=1 Tax=Psychromonas sp. Urea-02u-13 TaxID=2058326 RepID=UPI000C34C64A|nr:major capsid protein P2 [Psychromonas sp. Urea-02u-13]PKG39706.1 hypothetical protein CXF74_07070 [Psychromonas sp. Urea-02u-13]
MSQLLAFNRGRYAPKPHELNPMNAVGYGQKANLRLVCGPTYQNIEIKHNLNVTDILKVSMTLGGKEFVSLTGVELNELAKQRKLYVEAGRLVIPFSNPQMRTRQGVRAGELVTLENDHIMIYVELKTSASASDSEIVPEIKLRAQTTQAQPERFFLPRLFTLDWTANQSGETPFDWQDRDPRRTLRRLIFQAPDITKVEIKRDDLVEFESTSADNSFDLISNGRSPLTNAYVLDFLQYGFAEDGRFPTFARKSLDFRITKTNAGNIRLLVDQIEQVKALPQ